MGRLSGHRAVPFGPHFHCVSKIVNTYTYKTASSMQGRGEGRRSITASNLVVRKLPMQRTERQMVSSSHYAFIAVVACTDHPSLLNLKSYYETSLLLIGAFVGSLVFAKPKCQSLLLCR